MSSFFRQSHFEERWLSLRRVLVLFISSKLIASKSKKYKSVNRPTKTIENLLPYRQFANILI